MSRASQYSYRMVVLSRIYTRTGDDGSTGLGTGERVAKSHLRIHAYGTVDEANAVIGVARQHTRALLYAEVDQRLALIQNDLFDLGADLCCPDTGADLGYEPLRIVAAQVDRLEADIDEFNAEIKPLRSFVLPGGHPAAAHLHVARTVARRAERHMVELAAIPGEHVSPEALRYINRLSDFLFVASRFVNALDGQGDIAWVPGKTRPPSGG
jgi:cob(I)alamin adenosyltransferase